jgi:hypothetical protein
VRPVSPSGQAVASAVSAASKGRSGRECCGRSLRGNDETKDGYRDCDAKQPTCNPAYFCGGMPSSTSYVRAERDC